VHRKTYDSTEVNLYTGGERVSLMSVARVAHGKQ
jgi:hypothetical protein